VWFLWLRVRYKYYKKHSRSGLAWSRPCADHSLSQPTSVFCTTTGQISTHLDTILHTPIVVRNTLVGDLDCDRHMGGSRPNQNDYAFSVILVKHPKSYIETTDHCDFGGKPSKWRWWQVLSWKIPEFCNVGRPRSKKQYFSQFLGYPSTILCTA